MVDSNPTPNQNKIVFRKATEEELKQISSQYSIKGGDENTKITSASILERDGQKIIYDVSYEKTGLVNGYVRIIESGGVSSSYLKPKPSTSTTSTTSTNQQQNVVITQNTGIKDGGEFIETSVNLPYQAAPVKESIVSQQTQTQIPLYKEIIIDGQKTIFLPPEEHEIYEKARTGQTLTPSEGLKLAVIQAKIGANNPQQNQQGKLILSVPLSDEQKLSLIHEEKGLAAATETYVQQNPDAFAKSLKTLPFVGEILASSYSSMRTGVEIGRVAVGDVLGVKSKLPDGQEVKANIGDVGYGIASAGFGGISAFSTGYGVGTFTGIAATGGITAIGGPALASRIGIQALSTKATAVAIAEPVLVGGGITVAQAGISAAANVIQGREYNKDFEYIFSPQNIGTNIILAPSFGLVGMKTIGMAGLPSSTLGAAVRGAITGGIISGTFTAATSPSENYLTNTDIKYYEKPFVQNVLIGTAAGGILAGATYAAQSRGWNVNIGFQKGLEKTNQGVVQDIKGFAAVIEKVDVSGQTPTKFYGVAVMNEGAGIYVGSRSYVYRWSQIKPSTGGMQTEFGKAWYSYKTPEMQAIQREYFASKGINTDELRANLELKFGKEATEKFLNVLQQEKGYLAGSMVEKEIIRGSGITQSEYNPRLASGFKSDIDLFFVEKSSAQIKSFAKRAGIENLKFKGGSPLTVRNTIDTSLKYTGTYKGVNVDITVVKASPVPQAATGFAAEWLPSLSSQKGFPALSAKSLISMKSSTVAINPTAKTIEPYETGKEKYLIDYFAYTKSEPSDIIKTDLVPQFITAQASKVSSISTSSLSVAPITSSISSSISNTISKSLIPSRSSSTSESLSLSLSKSSSSSSSVFPSFSSSYSGSSSISSSSGSSSISSSSDESSDESSDSSSPSSPLSSSSSSSSSSKLEIITVIKPSPFIPSVFFRGEFVKLPTISRVKPKKQQWRDLLSGIQSNIKRKLKI